MIVQRPMLLAQNSRLATALNGNGWFGFRAATTTPSGAILPEPKRERFGVVSVVGSVIMGLLIGATISKNMANFLEENDLFVPSDDDDDDD